MEIIICLILGGVFFFFMKKFGELTHKIDSLSSELDSLKIQFSQMPLRPTSIPDAPQLVPVITTPPKAVEKIPNPVAIPVHIQKPIEPPKPQKSFKDTVLWKKLEAQFAENATGVIGTLAVVLGVIFLAVYAAILLPPEGRFGIICAFSLVLYGVYAFLQRKVFWQSLSLWIRSASGVLFLMGCLGSIGIESMKWVHDPLWALGLLALGLGANLVMGFLNKGQIFASIHVVLSLIALSMIPVNQMTFGISALVSLIGIVMSNKDKHWDRHVIATTVAFTGLHFWWLYQCSQEFLDFPVPQLLSLFICLVVGVAGLMSHYRKTYESSEIQKKPLLTHIITWVTMGLNLYAHSTGSVWSSAFLALGGVVAFALSMKAKKLSIHWLFLCDRLASLVMFLLSVISMSKVGLSYYEISLAMGMATAIFFRVSLVEFDKTLFKIINFTLLGCYWLVGFFTLVLLVDSKLLELSSFLFLLSSFIVLAFVFPAISAKAQEHKLGFAFNHQHFSGIEWPLGLHSTLAFFLVSSRIDQEWFLMIPLSILSVSVGLRERVKNSFLDLSVLLSAILSAGVAVFWILNSQNSTLSDAILCLTILSVGALSWKFNLSEQAKGRVTWAGVGFIWLALSISSYHFTKDITPILPGMAWLLISLGLSELKQSPRFNDSSSGIHGNTQVFMTLFGFFSLGMFLMRFFLVDLSNEALVFGFLRIRIFSEVLCVGVLLYWITYSQEIFKGWLNTLIDHLLEVIILVTAAFAHLEVESTLYPILVSTGSFACYFIGKNAKAFNRLMLYSFFFYLAGLFHVAFLSSSMPTPSKLFFDQSWVMGLIAIGLNTGLMVVLHKDKKSFQGETLNLPPALKQLATCKAFLDRHELKSLLYPLFLGVACFLFWSFERSVLSLLWVIECFVLFLISIVMREPQFRIVSMAGIGLIFIRMIFYDLTGQNFFIKAVVFISVGVILIMMNTIYNKYKHRYEST